MHTLEELRTRQAAITARLTAINDTANARPETERDLNEDEQREWDALDTEHTANAERIETLERGDRVRTARARWQSQTVMPDRGRDPFDGVEARSIHTMARGELRSRARMLLDEQREDTDHFELLEDQGNGDAAKMRGHIERLLKAPSSRNWNGDAFALRMLLSQREAYRTGFGKVLGGSAVFTGAEASAMDEMRTALQITNDANGGFAIPVLIDPSVIWTAQGTPNDFFDLARVENITNDEWKGVSSAGATAYWNTEGVKSTDGAPTFAQPIVTTKRISLYVPFSVEVQGDWPGFAAELTQAANLVFNEELVQKFTVGTGLTAQPTGVVTALGAVTASQVVNSDSGGATVADVYKIWGQLPRRYRRTSSWMAHTDIESSLRQAASVDNNFANNVSVEGIGRVMGRPFYENDYMSGVVASVAASLPLIVGDFKQGFLIANRVGMTVETVQHVIDTTSGTPTGQRAMFAWARVGSNVINANAFRILSQVA